MEHLIQEIKDYCQARGMALGTFGSRAVNDGKLMDRLQNKSGECLPRTIARIRKFMADNPAPAQEKAS